MFKNLIMFGILLIGGWVTYVSFFGKPEDIELRNRLFNKGKELGEVVTDIFKSESNKINAGEYDKIFKKLGETLDEIKKASKDKEKYNDEIKRLTDEKERLEKSVNENSQDETKLNEENKNLKKLADDILLLTKKIQE